MFDADPLLGAFQANYPSDRARLVAPAAVVIGVTAIIVNFTLAAVPEWWGPPLSVVVTAAVALVMGWRALHFWNREIVLYERGFTYREGARTVYFAYSEIVSIRQKAERLAYFGGLIRRPVYRFTLTTDRGERMVLGNLYRKVDRLGAQMEQRINAVMEPVIRGRLAAGEAIPFADGLRVSRDGLESDGRALGWGQYAGYRIGGGRMTLLAGPDGAEWLSLPLSEVDNITLLLKLLKEQRG